MRVAATKNYQKTHLYNDEILSALRRATTHKFD